MIYAKLRQLTPGYTHSPAARYARRSSLTTNSGLFHPPLSSRLESSRHVSSPSYSLHLSQILSKSNSPAQTGPEVYPVCGGWEGVMLPPLEK